MWFMLQNPSYGSWMNVLRDSKVTVYHEILRVPLQLLDELF